MKRDTRIRPLWTRRGKFATTCWLLIVIGSFGIPFGWPLFPERDYSYSWRSRWRQAVLRVVEPLVFPASWPPARRHQVELWVGLTLLALGGLGLLRLTLTSPRAKLGDWD